MKKYVFDDEVGKVEDTVIQLTEIRTAYPANDVSRAQMVADQKKIKDQAKISYKAGQEDTMTKKGHEAISYLEGYQDGKKTGIKEAWEILSFHLPINGHGECFYCGIGSIPDANGYHPDKDNVWNGDQLCWKHSSYNDARKLQARLKSWRINGS